MDTVSEFLFLNKFRYSCQCYSNLKNFLIGEIDLSNVQFKRIFTSYLDNLIFESF